MSEFYARMSHLSTGQRDPSQVPVSERSHFCPSQNGTAPPVSTEPLSSPFASRVSLGCRSVVCAPGLLCHHGELFVAARSRTRKGKRRSSGLSPSHSSQEIWSQVGHRANVPMCWLVPGFSLKSLKIRKENLEKKP